MEIWKKHIVDRIEDTHHFLESKEIHSFETVKEFFKNVFYNFMNEVEDSQASLVEKRHEIFFYIGELSMSIIDMGEQITIWKTSNRQSKIVASLFFTDKNCYVKYSNPTEVHYLSEDEIEDIFNKVFLGVETIH